MKKDFLTIPFAPNYEINSELIVRNKITGNFLKSYYAKANKNFVVHLYVGAERKRCIRSVKQLRKAAEINAKGMDWVKVPSLNYLYEISKSGCLRNVRTKRVLKLITRADGSAYYQAVVNGKVTSRSPIGLLWECHGIMPKKKPQTPIPVTIQKGAEKKYFPTMKECAEFLSKRVFLCTIYLRCILSRRESEIYGWNIKYHEPEDMTKVKNKCIRYNF